MRIALGLEYDGSSFSGWQKQPHARTIQNELESALFRISGHLVAVTAAGRTDAGVHATQQVVHFDTDVSRPLTAWIRGANSFLPLSIAIKWAKCVPDDFHARFCALSRRYSYFLLNRSVRSAMTAKRIGWCFQTLDVEKMRIAAELLTGTHDFSSFRASECQAKSPIKNLKRLDIVRIDNIIRFDFCADAFLHHMVRNIVGALLYVGKGAIDLERFRVVFESCKREFAPPTFMADGLYLTGVDYSKEFDLPITSDFPFFLLE